jgi:site-specific DNA recombinase
LIYGPTAEKSAGQRIPAANLEELVERRIRSFVADPVAILDAIPIGALDATGRKKLAAAAKTYVAGWDDETPDDLRRLLISMIVRVRVLLDRVDVFIDPMQMAAHLLKNGFGVAGLSSGAVADGHEEQPTILSIPTQLKRTGKELRFVVEGAREAACADRSLIRLLARAHKIGKRLHEAADLTIDKIAQDENITPSYATRLLRLTFLAPDIVTAILAGAHPAQLTANKLMADTRLPMDWREQRTALGFE